MTQTQQRRTSKPFDVKTVTGISTEDTTQRQLDSPSQSQVVDFEMSLRKILVEDPR